MAINYERLKARRFKPIEQSCSARDTILYALGLGLGHRNIVVLGNGRAEYPGALA